MTEFIKQNTGDEGQEELHIYTENGFLFIQTECEETHVFGLNKEEVEKLEKAIHKMKQEVYK